MSAENDPGEGTWSVFAMKVAEQRDECRRALIAAETRANREHARAVAAELECSRLREDRDEHESNCRVEEDARHLCEKRIMQLEQSLEYSRQQTAIVERKLAERQELLDAALRGEPK